MAYVGLDQSGFFKPFELLGQGIANAMQIRNARKARDLEQQRMGQEQTRWQAEQNRQKPLDELNINQGKLALQSAQSTFQQALDAEARKKALTDASNAFQPGSFFKDKSFSMLDPDTQQTVIDNFRAGTPIQLSVPEIAQEFDRAQTARYGPIQPPLKLPEGMQISELTRDGKGGEALKLTPKVQPLQVVTATDPETGETLKFVKDGSTTHPWADKKNDRQNLQAGEITRLGSIMQAESDLDAIEKMVMGGKPVGENAGGIFEAGKALVTGLYKQYWPGNYEGALYDQAVGAATPNLARGVFGEVGVLTDSDREEYKKQFPRLTDSQIVTVKKLKALRTRLTESRARLLETLKNAGRSVSNFQEPGQAASVGEDQTPGIKPRVTLMPPGQGQPAQEGQEAPKFTSEAEFRASNASVGWVLDPKTGKWLEVKKPEANQPQS
jgi:hypothetical protein